MRAATRRLLDRAFTAVSLLAVAALAAALLLLLGPIVTRGAGAFVFRGTVEHRRLLREQFGRGDPQAVARDVAAAAAARRPVYELLARFQAELDAADAATRRKYRAPLRELQEALHTLFGAPPAEGQALLLRNRYGATRWDQAQAALRGVLYTEEWDYSDPTRLGAKRLAPRAEQFRGTTLEPLFSLLEREARAMLRPRWTCYARFLTDRSLDAHFFGGIGPEALGTLYLAVGAMLFAVPFGLIAAIYLAEFAGEGRLVGLLRMCISTLAGVPSIVFGLFGLAFFIHALRVSSSKSVLAGALTLAVMILPTVIRAAEEALRAVPPTYKEAALSLGASRWHTVLSVVLPAALPGVLTGIVISLGRAAGETAPIIFTAAVSMGPALKPWETLSQPTPALSWNIYNLTTEHEAVERIRHVQFGMIFTLVALVLLLNAAALWLRARVSRKLRG